MLLTANILLIDSSLFILGSVYVVRNSLIAVFSDLGVVLLVPVVSRIKDQGCNSSRDILIHEFRRARRARRAENSYPLPWLTCRCHAWQQQQQQQRHHCIIRNSKIQTGI